MSRFADQVVVVTGAAQGIGAATAVEFYRDGAFVALLDKNDKVTELVKTLDPTKKRVFPVACDIRNEGEVAGAFRAVSDRFGRLDVLVNNAGVCPLNLCVDLTEAEWDLVLGVNLKGMWLSTKHFLRLVGVR